MLPPKLKGLAGDYMFDELSSEEYSNYKVLKKHLEHQLCKVESAKTYATMFWRQYQRDSETKTHLWEGLSKTGLFCPG